MSKRDLDSTMRAVRASTERAARKIAAARAAAGGATEPPSVDIEKLTRERDQFQNWWHTARETETRLRTRITQLESLLSAVESVARSRALHDPNDEIPF